jgi:hypothetical protein
MMDLAGLATGGKFHSKTFRFAGMIAFHPQLFVSAVYEFMKRNNHKQWWFDVNILLAMVSSVCYKWAQRVLN